MLSLAAAELIVQTPTDGVIARLLLVSIPKLIELRTANEFQVKRAGVNVEGFVHPVTVNTRLDPAASPLFDPNNPEIFRFLVAES